MQDLSPHLYRMVCDRQAFKYLMFLWQLNHSWLHSGCSSGWWPAPSDSDVTHRTQVVQHIGQREYTVDVCICNLKIMASLDYFQRFQLVQHECNCRRQLPLTSLQQTASVSIHQIAPWCSCSAYDTAMIPCLITRESRCNDCNQLVNHKSSADVDYDAESDPT